MPEEVRLVDVSEITFEENGSSVLISKAESFVDFVLREATVSLKMSEKGMVLEPKTEAELSIRLSRSVDVMFREESLLLKILKRRTVLDSMNGVVFAIKLEPPIDLVLTEIPLSLKRFVRRDVLDLASEVCEDLNSSDAGKPVALEEVVTFEQ